MWLFVVGVLAGGLTGAVVMALIVAADQKLWQRSDQSRTVNGSREVGATWVIAGNGSVTTGSRLGKFSAAKRRSLLPHR
jgi:hypothetical protein